MTDSNQTELCPVCDARAIEDAWLQRVKGVECQLSFICVPDDVQERISLIFIEELKLLREIEDLVGPYLESSLEAYWGNDGFETIDEVCGPIDPEFHH